MSNLLNFKKSSGQALRLKLAHSSGQALLIILLVIAVALTIGLAVVSRSITDIRISQQTEEAARAYSAAEAGIEEALVTRTSSEGPITLPETGTTYETAVDDYGAGTEFAFPQGVNRDEIQTLWLANQDQTKAYDRDALRVLWGNQGTSANDNTSTPALEVTIYYKDGTDKVGRFALDPYSGRSPTNSFCNPSSCSGVSNFITSGDSAGGKNFQFAATLDLSSFRGVSKVLLFVRLRLLYSSDSHILGAKIPDGAGGTGNLPVQGIRIESTGEAGAATRKVQVIQLHSAPPEIFDFVLYSGTGVTK